MYTLGKQSDKGLQKLLTRVAEETDYYRKLFSVCKGQKEIHKLPDFPFLDQQMVQRECRSFLCSRYQRFPDIEYLLLKRSFGLSGIPLEAYWDSRDDVCSQAFLWGYRKERFQITPDDKYCVFRTAEYAGNKIMDDMPKRLSRDGKILSFSMLDLSVERLQWCLDAIRSFEPAWICMPPSIAWMLAEQLTTDGQELPASLRYLELYGEMADMQVEGSIRDAFQVPTGKVYATQETGVVAASCTHGHLHIFPENVLVEIIRDGRPVVDKAGDIFITSLKNTAMPFIRLKTGDCGVLQSAACPCGQLSPVLHLTQGRKCSFINTVSGRKISAFLLRSLTEYTNEEISRCLAYIKFRQKSFCHMDVVLAAKPAFSGWEKETARIFLEKIQDMELRQMQWNFMFTDSHKLEEIKMDADPFFESWVGGES